MSEFLEQYKKSKKVSPLFLFAAKRNWIFGRIMYCYQNMRNIPMETFSDEEKPKFIEAMRLLDEIWKERRINWSRKKKQLKQKQNDTH